MVLEDKRHVTPFVSDPKVFFFLIFKYLFSGLASYPHSQHHTSTHLTFSLSLVFFSFSSISYLILSLSIFFSFSGPNLTLFFVPSLLLSSLFRWWKSFGSGWWVNKFQWDNWIWVFFFFFFFGRETGFGFNSNIVMEFWTLASVIGLRSFRFSWVSLWKRWRFLNNQTLSKGV